MTLGEDETVPVRPVRPLGIDPHDIEIQDLQHIDDGQRAAGMTGLGQGDHLDDILPHVSRMTAQFFAIHEKAPLLPSIIAQKRLPGGSLFCEFEVCSL